ncbi:hypothetical protein ANN_24679 [Periplaneta americana]|uniref:Transposase IS30-like HTH domain-containing protein n=1 Tax=Periplaneta americana TaxID=6978 RepID=A0ABQ8S3P3_PERAM|nr:hypothetical protein ANN_24679 [Periplaneta americana]
MERRHFTTSEMLRVVGMGKGSQSQARVARVLNTSRNVINRLWLRYQIAGEVKARQQGRGRKTTARQNRFLALHNKRSGLLLPWLASCNCPPVHSWSCCDQTIRNRLHGTSPFSRCSLRLPSFRGNNRAASLTWAEKHVNWGYEE